jgi:uncharacterized OsmC-like protein
VFQISQEEGLRKSLADERKRTRGNRGGIGPLALVDIASLACHLNYLRSLLIKNKARGIFGTYCYLPDGVTKEIRA